MNQGVTPSAEVMALPALPVRDRVAIEPAVVGDVRVCASVGPAAELVAVWSQIEHLPATMSWTASPGGVNFRDPLATRLVSARVTVTAHDPGPLSVVSITELGLANFTAQPLPGGSILLVAHRCRWRPDGADRNAVVYGADGDVVTEEVLGDGISHVLADSAGNVWVGYTEEGIYGNYGWGYGGGPEPVGSSGLVRWSPDFRPDWRYPGATSGFGGISDCCALNVDGTTAWTCYDGGHSIVRIDDGELAGWRNDLGPRAALAVDGSRAALFGGFGRLTVGELSSGRFEPTAEYRVVQPSGSPLPPHTQIVGRGSSLHFLTDDCWYQLTIRDIPAQPAASH
jgi:hypothetical protein